LPLKKLLHILKIKKRWRENLRTIVVVFSEVGNKLNHNNPPGLQETEVRGADNRCKTCIESAVVGSGELTDYSSHCSHLLWNTGTSIALMISLRKYGQNESPGKRKINYFFRGMVYKSGFPDKFERVMENKYFLNLSRPRIELGT
jgi:hypothetical protein